MITHWVLIYALHFGAHDLQQGQLYFQTKNQCVNAGKEINSGFTSLWTKMWNPVNYVCIPYERES
jgi:hypothetical protein